MIERIVKFTLVYELIIFLGLFILSIFNILTEIESYRLTQLLPYYGAILLAILGCIGLILGFKYKKISYIAIFFSISSLLGFIISLLLNKQQIILNYIWFVICFLGLLFLFLSDTVHYFFHSAQVEIKKDRGKSFTYNEFKLFCKDIILQGSNRTQRIYFFSKNPPKSGLPCSKPDGYDIGINKRTGMPYLKKEGK